ncbi:hypothetical protein RI367_008776 [Sorochytrium milnesiophthora]
MTNTPAIWSNPLFALRLFDAHVDTPVEVLHTVLLGPVKYVLQTLVKSTAIEQKSTLIRRLNVLNADGFLRNFSGHQDMLGALSWLVVVVYSRTISDIAWYQLEVKGTLNWLLLCVSQARPHLLLKRKFHYLRHIHDSCRRFGPPILTATETFEGFNGVIRRQFGRTNWHNSYVPFNGTWVQAGPDLLSLLSKGRPSRAVLPDMQVYKIRHYHGPLQEPASVSNGSIKQSSNQTQFQQASAKCGRRYRLGSFVVLLHRKQKWIGQVLAVYVSKTEILIDAAWYVANTDQAVGQAPVHVSTEQLASPAPFAVCDVLNKVALSVSLSSLVQNPVTARSPTAVTIKDSILVINIRSNRKSSTHGFLSSIFGILDRHGVVVDMITTSEVHVSMAIPVPHTHVKSSSSNGSLSAVKSGRSSSSSSGSGSSSCSSSLGVGELPPHGNNFVLGGAAYLSVDNPNCGQVHHFRHLEVVPVPFQRLGAMSYVPRQVILSVVGKHMRNMVGTAGMMFSILAADGINIEMISQGASEINISCVIALDAGFFTALNIKPKLLSDIASIVFTIFYLVFADQADNKINTRTSNDTINKVRRLRATPTVELMRMSWEKQNTLLFRAISRAGLPRLTYMYRQILVPRHPSSYGYNVADPRTQHISCYLLYKGAASTYPHASQLLLQYPGGGFVCMDPACHEDYLTLVPRHRHSGKAPEYPYPYAMPFELYRLLRETNGVYIRLEDWDKVIETEEYKNGATEPISPRRVKRKSPIKITIVGDSAGGNISASVTVRIVESRQTIMMPDALILIYPILAFDMACWMPPQHIHLLRVESVKQVNELVSLKSLLAANNAQTSASPPQSPNLLSNGLARRSKSAIHMSTSHGESDDEHQGSGRHRLCRKKSFYEMASGALQSLRTQKPHTVFDKYGGSGLAHTYTPTSPYPGGGSRDTHAALTSDSLNLDVSEDDSPTDTEDIRKQTDVYHQENVYGLEPRNHALANAVPPSTGTVNSSLAMTSRMSYFNDRVLTPEVMRALAVV